jgi:hypothetical protein
MWTDGTDDELHEFAEKLGLKRSWCQEKKRFRHYDLVRSKRELAIKNGAKELSLKEWLKKLRNE